MPGFFKKAIKTIKKGLSDVNDAVNPLPKINRQRHQAKEDFIADLRAQEAEVMQELQADLEACRNTLLTRKHELRAKQAADLAATIVNLEAQFAILDALQAALLACVTDKNLNSLDTIAHLCATNPDISLDDFLFCNPLGIAIIYDSKNAINKLIALFGWAIDPQAANLTGVTVLECLRLEQNASLTYRILELRNKNSTNSNAKKSIALLKDTLGLDVTNSNALNDLFVADNTNNTEKVGFSPLTYYISLTNGDHNSTITSLIHAGADLLQTDLHGNVPLLQLVKHSKDNILRVAVDNGWYSDAALQLAIDQQYESGIQLLNYARFRNTYFSQTGDVYSAINSSGHTPLTLAVNLSLIGCIDVMLSLGAPIDQPSHYGYTPLHQAIIHKNLPILRQLISAGANIELGVEDISPYKLAVQYGFTDGVDYLLLTIKARKFLKFHDFTNSNFKSAHHIHKYSALTQATRYADISIMDWLYESGTDLNAVDGNNISAMHVAIQTLQTDKVYWLLRHGANLQQSMLDLAWKQAITNNDSLINHTAGTLTSYGMTYSAAKETYHLVKFWKELVYMDFGFYLNRIHPKSLFTPLTLAASQNNILQVSRLLVSGANINASNGYGYNPLHLAAKYNYIYLAYMLVTNGANVNVLTNDGKPLTAYQIAIELNYPLNSWNFLAQQHVSTNNHKLFAPRLSDDVSLADDVVDINPHKHVTEALNLHGAIDFPLTPIINPINDTRMTWQTTEITKNDHEIAQLLINYGARNLTVISPTHKPGTWVSTNSALQVQAYLSTCDGDKEPIWVVHKDAAGVEQQLVYQCVEDQQQAEYLLNCGALYCKPYKNYVLRPYYAGLSVSTALQQLNNPSHLEYTMAVKTLIIAKTLHRLDCLLKSGHAPIFCTANSFVWQPDLGACKFVSFAYLGSNRGETAELAIEQLSSSLLDITGRMPDRIRSYLQQLRDNAGTTQLSTIYSNIYKELHKYVGMQYPITWQKNTLSAWRATGKSLTITTNLPAALNKKKSAPINLNQNVIARYARNSQLVIPPDIPMSIRHLINILRQEQVLNLPAMIESLEKVQYVSTNMFYSVVQTNLTTSTLHSVCLWALQKLLSQQHAIHLYTPLNLEQKLECYIASNKHCLPDDFANLPSSMQHIIAITKLYNITINLFSANGSKSSIGLHATNGSINIISDAGNYYLLKEVTKSNLHQVILKLLNHYYAAFEEGSERQKLIADFKQVNNVCPTATPEHSAIIAVIQAILRLDAKPPIFAQQISAEQLDLMAQRLTAKVAKIPNGTILEKIATVLNIRINEFAESSVGMHTVLDAKYTVKSLTNIKSYTAPTNLKTLPVISILNHGVKYSALRLSKQQRWVVPANYTAQIYHATPSIICTPRDKLKSTTITKTGKPIRIQHIVGQKLHYSIVTPALCATQELLLLENKEHLYDDAYMVSVGLELAAVLNASNLNFATSLDITTHADLLLTSIYDVNNIQINNLNLLHHSVVNNHLPSLQVCKTLYLDPAITDNTGVSAIIAAARVGNWDIVKYLVKLMPLSGKNMAIFNFDATSGKCLNDVIEDFYTRLDPIKHQEQIAAAEKVVHAINMLSFLHHQADTAAPFMVLTIATELHKDGWLDAETLADYELIAQYHDLVNTSQDIGGLSLSEVELTVLAMLLKLQIKVETGLSYAVYGEDDWAESIIIQAKSSDKAAIINHCVNRAKTEKTIPTDTKDSDILANVARHSAMIIASYSEDEKRDVRYNIAPALKIVKLNLLQSKVGELQKTAVPDLITHAKASYTKTLPKRQEAITQYYTAAANETEAKLLEVEDSFVKQKSNIRNEFIVIAKDGVEKIDTDYKKIRKKVKGKLVATTITTVAATYATMGLASAFNIATNTLKYAALKGAVSGVASALADGKFSLKKFSKGMLGSVIGFKIGEALNSSLQTTNTVYDEVFRAIGDSLATRCLDGDFKGAVPLALLDGFIQGISSDVANMFAPLPINTDGISAISSRHYFVVGASSTVLHSFANSVIYDTDFDITSAFASGMQSVLTHWAATDARQRGWYAEPEQPTPQPRQRINAAQQNDAINDEASGEPEPNIKQESKPAPKATSKQKTPPKPAEPKKAEAKQSTQRASTVPTFDFDNSDYLHAGESYRPTPGVSDLEFVEQLKLGASMLAGSVYAHNRDIRSATDLASMLKRIKDDPREINKIATSITRAYQQMKANGWKSIPKAYINNVYAELDRADRYMRYGDTFKAGFTRSAVYTNVGIDAASLLIGGYGFIRVAPKLFNAAKAAGARFGSSKPGMFFGFGAKSGGFAGNTYAQGSSASYKHPPIEKWTFDDRIKGQLVDPRLGKLSGKIDNKKLYELAHNPDANFFLDTNSGRLNKGHINIIQKIDGLKEGMVLRITVVRDEMKIISVGIVKESSYLKYTAPGGRYVKIGINDLNPSFKM